AGWVDDATLASNFPGNSTKSFQVTLNNDAATLVYGNKTVQFTYTNDPLNDGMLGLGLTGTSSSFTSITVQTIPRVFTYQVAENYSDGVADDFTPQAGTWAVSGGRYNATPPGGADAALSTRPLSVVANSYVEYQATVKALAAGAWAGQAFAATDANNFL